MVEATTLDLHTLSSEERAVDLYRSPLNQYQVLVCRQYMKSDEISTILASGTTLEAGDIENLGHIVRSLVRLVNKAVNSRGSIGSLVTYSCS